MTDNTDRRWLEEYNLAQQAVKNNRLGIASTTGKLSMERSDDQSPFMTFRSLAAGAKNESDGKIVAGAAGQSTQRSKATTQLLNAELARIHDEDEDAFGSFVKPIDADASKNVKNANDSPIHEIGPELKELREITDKILK